MLDLELLLWYWNSSATVCPKMGKEVITMIVRVIVDGQYMIMSKEAWEKLKAERQS